MLAGWLSLKWLLESPAGVSWLFRAISGNSPVSLSARSITGGLGSTLQLQGFSARWAEGEITVADLRLRCQPLLLPFHILSIQELSLKKVQFLDNIPSGIDGPEIPWPHITGFPTRLNGWIDRLKVEDFSYRNLDKPPISISDASAAVAWHDARLNITNLAMSTAYGLVSGGANAGFGEPSLVSKLNFEPLRPLVGCDKFELRTKLKPGRPPEQLTGELTATAHSGADTRYTLTGSAGVTRKGVNLKELILTEKGRQGRVVLAGAVSLGGTAQLRMKADRVDLAPELGSRVAVSGSLLLNTTPERYVGSLDLTTTGYDWQNSRITARVSGDYNAAEFSALNAAIIGGSVQGNLKAEWRELLTVKAALHGSELDPARLDPTLNGVVNFDMNSMATWSAGRLKRAEVDGRLLKSRLRGRVLSGEIAADLKGDNLKIARLYLTGNGFDIRADGTLGQRLNLAAKISDLSGLIPRTKGSLSVRGWGRFAAGVVNGELSGEGHNLAADGVRIASALISAEVSGGGECLMKASADLGGVKYNGMKADNVVLRGDGALPHHQLSVALRSAGSDIMAKLSGGYTDGIWQGDLKDFRWNDLVGSLRLQAPASFAVSSKAVTLSPLTLIGLPTERAELSWQMLRKPLSGSGKIVWNALELARANRWLSGVRLDGQSSGSMELGLSENDRMTLVGKTSASGKITLGAQSITIRKALLNLEAGDRGTSALLEFQTGEGISASGRFTSAEPARLSLPSGGDLKASWSGVNAADARRWFPEWFDLQGGLSGEINGRLLADKRFDLTGTATLADGAALWRSKGGELKASVSKAGLNWNWRGDTLEGTISLSLAKSGEAQAIFRLPLPARFGAAADPSGKVQGRVSGRFSETGILMTLFPGLIQDTKGKLEIDLRAGGTWGKPSLTGTAVLTQAGAFLPGAGILLSDVRLNASLDGSVIHISSFKVTSGGGSLEGSADLDFAGKKLTRYQGALRGKRFQVLHLPELQLSLSPDLTFEGDPEKYSVRGDVLIPEMLVNSQKASSMIKPSRDALVSGRGVAPSQKAGLRPDLQLHLLLGDKVVVKAEGLDARLEGGIDLKMSGSSPATGNGEIRVARGSYSVYGVKLDIKRGRAIFSGGAVERPTLDVLALRNIDDVKAGVIVTGTPEAPQVKLYSEPAHPDTDILAYIVLGRKLGESGQQTALLMQAASMLISPGQGAGLQNKLKQLVHLDTLTYSTDNDRTPTYKPIEPGLLDTQKSGNGNSSVSQSMLLLGKYLTPQLYVSYGRSLFTASQQLRARYSISKRWEVESKVSAEATGGDLYFKIELD